MSPELLHLFIAALAATATPLLAEPPRLKTPSPVIYLADNLDEKDELGWCIDTLGRGFAERLQAHSCKPQGGDVQFSLDAQTRQIRSVEYPEYCMAHRPSDESTFALVPCDATATDQKFVFNSDAGTIQTAADDSACVSVGERSRSAGPFMSRSLVLTNCSSTERAYKEWVVLP